MVLGNSVWAAVALVSISACNAKPPPKQEARASASSPTEPTQLVDAYDVTLSSRVTVKGQRLMADVRGVLSVSPPWQDSTGRWRTLRLVPGEVALAAGNQRQSSLAGIDKPFAIRVDDAGALQEVAFDEQLPAESRRVQQAIAGYVQFSCAKDGAQPKWALEEADASGKYQAQYERADPEWVSKRKLAYAVEAVQLDVQRSEMRYRARCGEFPREVVVAEELVGKELGLVAETTLSVRQRANREPLAASAIGKLLPGQRRFSPSAVAELVAREPADLQPISVEVALAALEPVAESIFDHKTVRRLSARLTAKPEELSLLQRDYEQNELHRHAVSRLLVAIGSPESWALVTRLLDDTKLPTSARIELLTALLFAQRADLRALESVHALGRSEVETLASAAVNTEGSLLKRAQDTGEKGLQPLLDRYAAGLRPTLPTRVQAAYLQGFSYIGTQPLLEELRRATLSETEAIRVAAMSALEGVAGDQADAWVLDRLANDASAAVRERAIRTCGYRATLRCGKAVARALVSDRDRLVRLRALEVFSQAGNPAVTFTLLERVAQKDPDPSLRRAASDALTRLRAQQTAAQNGATKTAASPANPTSH